MAKSQMSLENKVLIKKKIKLIRNEINKTNEKISTSLDPHQVCKNKI